MDRSETVERVRNSLRTHPELRGPLEQAVELDTERSWSFDDLDCDSGTFGELVSADFVERDGDGYRLTDRSAVVAGLSGDTVEEPGDGLATSVPRPDTRLTGAVVGVLAVVFLMRWLPMHTAVYRSGTVVFAGNDPYFYVYWVEILLETPELSAFDPSALGELPRRVTRHDTLTIVGLWWAAALFDGAAGVGSVLAWAPLAAALVTATAIYAVTARVTHDRRVGLAAVILLAFTPAHAFRTALGFVDHHAFDYVWLAVTIYGVVRAMETDHRDTVGTVASVAVVAVGVAGQTLSWRGGPLYLIPIGVVVVVGVSRAVRRGERPTTTYTPLLGGVALGAVITWVAHAAFGWASFVRAVSPVLLTVAAVVVAVIGDLTLRASVDHRVVLGVSGVSAVGVGVAALLGVPGFAATADALVAYFARTNQSGIAETYSLVSGSTGAVFGPILILGLTLFLAVPYVVLVSVRESSVEDELLSVAVYVWYFLLLSLVQIRFAGALAVVAVVFAGVAFVRLAAAVGLADRADVFGEARRGESSEWTPTLPKRTTLGSWILLFLLVSSFGLVQTPVKMSQVAVDGSTYDTARWIEDHAERVDRSYPENYVFSSWGRNRVYNYYVSGESETYTFAQDYYEPFLSARDTEDVRASVERLRRHGVGYVVVPNEAPESGDSVWNRLATQLGGGVERESGLGHFRLVHTADNGPNVFEYVTGARVTGTAAPNSRVVVETTVEVDGDRQTYTRETETNRYGDYGVTVPYDGTYRVGDGNRKVTATDVVNGSVVGEYLHHFPFDEGAGNRSTDPVGGATAKIRGGGWADGVDDNAVELDASDQEFIQVDDARSDLGGSESFTVCSRVNPANLDSDMEILHVGSFGVTLGYDTEYGWTTGFRNQSRSGFSVNAPVENETVEWTHVCGRYDGERLSIYVDGERQASRNASGRVLETVNRVFIGSVAFGDGAYFDGRIDDVRIYRHALDEPRLYSGKSNRTNTSIRDRHVETVYPS